MKTNVVLTVAVAMNALRSLDRLKNVAGVTIALQEAVVQTQVQLAEALLTQLKGAVPFGLNDYEKACLANGQKVLAIKSVRVRKNMGLGEAKQFTENEGFKLGLLNQEFVCVNPVNESFKYQHIG